MSFSRHLSMIFETINKAGFTIRSLGQLIPVNVSARGLITVLCGESTPICKTCLSTALVQCEMGGTAHISYLIDSTVLLVNILSVATDQSKRKRKAKVDQQRRAWL